MGALYNSTATNPPAHSDDCESADGSARDWASCRICCSLLLGLIALLGADFLTSVARGQASDERAAPTYPEIINDGVLNTQARLRFLDPNGQPVLVPDSSLDELFRLRSERGENSSGIPNWSFSSVNVDVDASGEASTVAIVRAQLAIKLGNSPREATAGLRLGTILLTEQPAIDETLDQSAFRTLPDGHQWQLKGKPQSEHSIQLLGKCVIDRDADRQTLLLALPMSTCQVHVKLPRTSAQPRTRDSSDIIESELTEDARLVTITSSGGDMEISWLVDRPSARVAAIKAQTVTKFSIRDPQQVWTATTDLDLQWYGSEASNKITVALPPGARIRTSLTYDFEMFEIRRNLVGQGEQAQEVLEIENYRIEQTPTLKFQFQWEWQPVASSADTDTSESAAAVSIAPPQIDGADMHRGEIECLFQSQYRVTLALSDEISLSRQSRTEAGKLLGFAFDSQQSSVQLTLRREQSLPVVRPTYHVKVDANKLTLTGWLECSFDANQLSRSIGIDMPNWVLQENNARVVVSGSSADEEGEVLEVRQDPNAVGRYTLTGPELATPTFGGVTRVEQTWRFVARRDIDAGDGLEIQIPEIVRSQAGGQKKVESGSGVLILSSADNILLKASPTVALLEDSYSQQYQQFVPTGGRRTPLVYRFQPSVNRPYWAGTADRLPQQIAYAENAAVNVLPELVEISQRFDLQIANSPIEQLRFAVPVADGGAVSNGGSPPLVYVDDILVGARLVDTTDTQILEVGYSSPSGATYRLTSGADDSKVDRLEASKKTWRVFEVVAPPEMLGTRSLRIQSEAQWIPDEAQRDDNTTQAAAVSTGLTVPLAKLLLPSGAQRSGGRWTLRSAGGLTTSSPSAVLTDGLEEPTSKDLPSRVLPRSASSVAVTVSEQVSSNAALQVERMWLQTAITRVHRRDRFVAHIRMSMGPLRLSLPKFIDDIRVFVDGVSREDYRYDYASDSLIIDVAANESSEHVIEVTYFQQENLSWLRRLEMKPPRIDGTSAVGDFYWELLTPQTQHIAWCPAGLTSNWSWVWAGFWWNRASPALKFERALEETTQSRLPVSMNRYVMSSNRVRSEVHVWVLSRFSLWFPVGLAAILIAYSILNFELFRRPLMMVGYAVVVASLALLWPDFAMLLAQTSVFALSLVGLVWVTQVAVDSRVRRRSVFNSRSVSQQDSVRKYASSRAVAPAASEVGSTRSAGSGVAASEGR
ncbi:MAG: hypothetical protein Aurels2KO_49150 [Aureliella sp.]